LGGQGGVVFLSEQREPLSGGVIIGYNQGAVPPIIKTKSPKKSGAEPKTTCFWAFYDFWAE